MAEQHAFSKALREARLAAASQLDAALDLRDARALRLDALRADIMPQLVGHPEAKALFDLHVQPGATPKLWLDLISSVVMEPDPRSYRLVQDHESRRETVFETTDMKAMSAYVLKYLAHRIVTHEKLSRGVSGPKDQGQKDYSIVDLIYVWITGCAFGVLGLMIVAMLLGKLSF